MVGAPARTVFVVIIVTIIITTSRGRIVRLCCLTSLLVIFVKFQRV